MVVESFTGEPHLLSEGSLGRHSLLHLLKLLRLHMINNNKESGTYLLHIVYLYGVWRLDVALLDQQLGVSVLFLLLLRLLGAQLPFYLLFFDVRILDERLLKVIFNSQMWGVPWVRSVLTSITLEGIFWRRQIVATTLIGKKGVLLSVFSLLFNLFGISDDG